MLRQFVLAIGIVAMTASTASAQTDAPAPAAQTKAVTPAPPPAPGASAPRPPRQPVNVKIDITITDQHASVTTKKNVTLVVADGEPGGVRSTSQVAVRTRGSDSFTIRNLPLNIDALPFIIDAMKVRLGLTLNLDLQDERGDNSYGLTTSVTERVTAVLETGKSMIVAQSADPISDRQVTVEVKATILR